MNNFQTDLFHQYIRPKEELLFQIRIELGVMAMNKYNKLP